MKYLIKEELGISLLEVLITALMIGLLSAIVTLSVDYYLTDGKNRIVAGDLATLAAAARLYILDHGFPTPATFSNPTAVLVPDYLPEMPIDPYSRTNSIYVIQLHPDPADNNIVKIYLGSCGEDGVITYDGDDIFRYVK